MTARGGGGEGQAPAKVAGFASCTADDLTRISLTCPSKDGRAMVTVNAADATSVQFQWWAKRMLLEHIGVSLPSGFWPVSSRIKFCSFLIFMGKVTPEKMGNR